jgi:hypothetical protein
VNPARRILGLIVLAAKLVWLVAAPSLPETWLMNHRVARRYASQLDYDSIRDSWARKLRSPKGSRRQSVAQVYQASFSRMSGLESKAVGMLQAAALVGAGALAACVGPLPAAILGIVGIVYVITAASACCWVLIPRARHSVVLNDTMSSTDGHAEMATSVKMLEPQGIRVSNMVTSAAYDLIRAVIVTIAALLILVLHAGIGSSADESNSTQPAVTPSPSLAPHHFEDDRRCQRYG